MHLQTMESLVSSITIIESEGDETDNRNIGSGVKVKVVQKKKI